MQILKVWVDVAEAMGEAHGTPLPKSVLVLGNLHHGWGVQFNNSGETIGRMTDYQMNVYWNGWPAAVIYPAGGEFAAGEAANQEAFQEWLESIKESGNVHHY